MLMIWLAMPPTSRQPEAVRVRVLPGETEEEEEMILLADMQFFVQYQQV